MLKRILSPIGLVCLVVVVMSCGSATEPASNEKTASAQPSPIASQTASLPCPSPSPEANRKIVVRAPCDGAKVAQRHFVEGRASDSNGHVWVIVHPMESSDYWVQPSVTVREGGRWKVLCYFGEPGQQYVGEHYEIVAIQNPRKEPSGGQLVAGWPESESRSQIVEVVRE